MGKAIDHRHKPIPEIEIPSIGFGTLRTSATVMAVLLQAKDPETRIDILADLIERFAITPDEISARINSVACPHCGMADYLHDNGPCPQPE